MNAVNPVKGKRVFIFDDNAANVMVLRTLVRQQGAVPVVGFIGRGEAHRIAEHLPLDLVCLDLMLPGGHTGFDLFEEMQQVEALAGVPVVAVSAADASVAMGRARSLGFRGFLAKPLDPDRFPSHLERLLTGEEVWIPR